MIGLEKEAIQLGTEAGLFVDAYLIEQATDTVLTLNRPEQREIVIRFGAVPWEKCTSGSYPVVLQDGNRFRLYYRVYFGDGDDYPDDDEQQGYCCAESDDGIHWIRPEYGLIDYNGSKKNNLFLTGPLAHNLAPFIDKNPAALPDQRYKAVAGELGGLSGLVSADGLNWRLISDQALITEGAFDSQNVVFWHNGRYVCWSRYYHELSGSDSGLYSGVRAIQSCESEDFILWGAQRHNVYRPGIPYEHFYTNAVTACPGAAGTLLSFPMRLVTGRKKVPEHPYPDISDNVILSSQDGVNWERPFLQAWSDTTTDRRNWTERNHQVAAGILQTTPDEFSLYVTHHMRWDDMYLRRYSVPRHRFASIHADYTGGTLLTKPLIVSGKRLILNYATSAPGSVQVQLEENGLPVPGFTFADCDAFYGNELDYTVPFQMSLAGLSGHAVRLRFRLVSADLFSLRFA